MPRKTVHPTQLRRQKESTNKRKPRVTTKPPKKSPKPHDNARTNTPMVHAPLLNHSNMSLPQPKPSYLPAPTLNRPHLLTLPSMAMRSILTPANSPSSLNSANAVKAPCGNTPMPKKFAASPKDTATSRAPTQSSSSIQPRFLQVGKSPIYESSRPIGPKNQTLIVSVGPSAAT
jgi:hypothetical protein